MGLDTAVHADVDDIYRVLSHGLRRIAFRHLSNAKDGPRTVNEFVERIASDEGVSSWAGRRSWDRFRIALWHNHLSLLADVGLVESDPEAERIQLCGNPLVEELLVDLSVHAGTSGGGVPGDGGAHGVDSP